LGPTAFSFFSFFLLGFSSFLAFTFRWHSQAGMLPYVV
jgi:hypothetical protein